MIKKYNSKILSIKEIENKIKIFKISRPEDFNFKAGQYVSLDIPNKEKKIIRREYSVCSSPDETEFIELCIRHVEGGVASEYIKELKINDLIIFIGPMGDFSIPEEVKDNEIAFISSGTGIGPFVSMTKDLLKNSFNKKVLLIKESIACSSAHHHEA